MPYDWTNWKRHIHNQQNHEKLKKYYAFEDPSSANNYRNFNFLESRFGRKYFIQVHAQPDCIYVYFDTKGQTKEERIVLRDMIIKKLRQIIEENEWSFSLKGEGQELGDGNIKYRIVNKDLTSIDDYQKMINVMILIADNLQTIEAGKSIVTGSGKEKTDECFPAKVKKNVPKKEGKPMCCPTQQKDCALFPSGVSETDFNKFCKLELTGHNGRKMAVPHFASWAVWDKWNSTKESKNTNLQISTLFSERKGDTLTKLQPNIVFVGLNISQPLENGEWTNIHEDMDYPNAQFRYALWQSVFWGAYFTDFIKGYEETQGASVQQYFSKNKKELNVHRKNFITEMLALKEIMKKDFPLVIILLGKDAQDLFTLSKCEEELKVKFEKIYVYNRDHYSRYRSYEKYREHFLTLENKIKNCGIQL